MASENQHLISQVYLKGFGYKDKSNQWKISTLDRSQVMLMEKNGKKWISQKSIESFLSEINIFDFAMIQGRTEKIYEEFNRDIENNYLKIISDLESAKLLSPLSEVTLYSIVINFLIRTRAFRQEIDSILKGNGRYSLLYEVFSSIKNGKLLARAFEKIPAESELNYISLMLWERIMPVFSEFEYSIFLTEKHEGWFTSDNPVVIKDFVTTETIFSRNAQIIFPINRRYLAYFYHPDNKSVDLKGFKNRDIKYCDPTTKNEIIMQIINNVIQFAIFPNEFYWKE
jgi:hypothetical protein